MCNCTNSKLMIEILEEIRNLLKTKNSDNTNGWKAKELKKNMYDRKYCLGHGCNCFGQSHRTCGVYQPAISVHNDRGSPE